LADDPATEGKGREEESQYDDGDDNADGGESSEGGRSADAQVDVGSKVCGAGCKISEEEK
jgi:hypothetical protein